MSNGPVTMRKDAAISHKSYEIKKKYHWPVIALELTSWEQPGATASRGMGLVGAERACFN